MANTIMEEIAPTLSSAFSGPFNGLARNFVAEKLGTNDLPTTGKPDKYIEKFADTTENVQRLRQIEQEFKQELKKLDINPESITSLGREKSSNRDTTDRWPHIFLSVSFVTAYFMLLGFMFWSEISENVNPGMYKVINDGKVEWLKQGESLVDLFQILMGVLTAGVAQILNYWFGSRSS